MKFLSKPWIRWAGWFAVATMFGFACVALATWQLERRAEAVSKIERVVANYELEPLKFSEIAALDSENAVYLEWRQVELTGEYLPTKTLLVRNRAIAGQPGFIQLVPFRVVTGEIIIIERGWVAAGSDLQPSQQFPPSSSQKKIAGRVQLGEIISNRDSPIGQLTSINLPEIQASLGLSLETDFYLRIVSESPSESSYPQAQSRPVLDEGNHLSYAVQWVIFAVMGFFAVFWAIRQEREFRRMEANPHYIPKSRQRGSNVDSNAEDEILDRTR